MKKKIWLFILAGILIISFMFVSVFFAFKGLYASKVRNNYFDVYKEIATEYILSDENMIDKHGKDFNVEFESTVQYQMSDDRPSGIKRMFLEVFAPDIPQTIDEFNSGIKTITFMFSVESTVYEITFEKNETGELSVSDITEAQ